MTEIFANQNEYRNRQIQIHTGLQLHYQPQSGLQMPKLGDDRPVSDPDSHQGILRGY